MHLSFSNKTDLQLTALKMILPLILATWIAVAESSSEHSLMFTYTYMNKPPADKPAFYAERQLNGRTFASYSSWTNTSRPEAEWVKDHPTMWTRNNSRGNKQSWFKINTEIMIARMNLSASENHVLEWIHGCRATTGIRGRLVFTRGEDRMFFNGKPLLALDYDTLKFRGLERRLWGRYSCQVE